MLLADPPIYFLPTIPTGRPTPFAIMQNEAGQNVDLYIPRKWSVLSLRTIRIID